MSDLRTDTLQVGTATYEYYPIDRVEGSQCLPLPLRVVLENILRNVEDPEEAHTMAQRVVDAAQAGQAGDEVEFAPARVLFQDFTGVPVFVDFAVMREACKALGGDPSKINPQVPCDLVIDHSVIADSAGCADALAANMELEYKRNGERYDFLKWAQGSFDNVRITPPGAGICHQLNIERFADVVMTRDGGSNGHKVAYFDTVVGTDSHTPTVNGLGVLGWGVGGIEAEAAALGQPITTLVPKVYGLRLVGELGPGVAAMDLALTIAQLLREKGVVGSFVECFGPGLAGLSATQRACISNMTPEYGSTCTLFPVDQNTIDYLRVTGRSEEQCNLVEAYAKAQGLWGMHSKEKKFADVMTLKLDDVQRSLAGPSRPHKHIDFTQSRDAFRGICKQRGLNTTTVQVDVDGQSCQLTHGAIAIAAVTSCTTATDPAMMLAAGMLAKNAAAAGLRPKPWVKTILAPGSHATQLLLERVGLTDGLNQLGFYTCGFGCMSCIGNSGPLMPQMHDVADTIQLASVLSGNRNFDGRISPDVSQNFLSAPAGVIAYALAGTMDFDFASQSLGTDADGNDIMLADIWPSDDDVRAAVEATVDEDLFVQGNAGMFEGDDAWKKLDRAPSDIFEWDEASTYVRRATYFDGMTADPEPSGAVTGARVLANLGDFITTDHISPAGAIAPDSCAADYLREHGVLDDDFNTYGSRRGNHEVMARGTFANVKLQNALADGRVGGWTRDMVDGQIARIFDVSSHYEQSGIASVVFAGKMYGSGSSRDWAAKGPMLLGVRAAFAESFERIHRSNLIGMGVLPLQFEEGQNAALLGLDGTESIDIEAIDFSKGLPQPSKVAVHATKDDGSVIDFHAIVRVDTPTEGHYFYNGGILQYVIRNLSK